MQRQPGLDRCIVVQRVQRAAGLRGTKPAARAVHFVRHTKLFPRHDSARRYCDDQCPRAFGLRRMGGGEFLDAARAVDTKSSDCRPAATSPWDPYSQVGKGSSSVRMQCLNDAR